jgi:hypothetical protein
MLRQPRETGLLLCKTEKATVPNKPQKPENLIQALYSKAERKIVLQFDKNTGFIPTDKQAMDALNMVNRALVDNNDVFSPPSLCSRLSRNNA